MGRVVMYGISQRQIEFMRCDHATRSNSFVMRLIHRFGRPAREWEWVSGLFTIILRRLDCRARGTEQTVPDGIGENAPVDVWDCQTQRRFSCFASLKHRELSPFVLRAPSYFTLASLILYAVANIWLVAPAFAQELPPNSISDQPFPIVDGRLQIQVFDQLVSFPICSGCEFGFRVSNGVDLGPYNRGGLGSETAIKSPQWVRWIISQSSFFRIVTNKRSAQTISKFEGHDVQKFPNELSMTIYRDVPVGGCLGAFANKLNCHDGLVAGDPAAPDRDEFGFTLQKPGSGRSNFSVYTYRTDLELSARGIPFFIVCNSEPHRVCANPEFLPGGFFFRPKISMELTFSGDDIPERDWASLHFRVKNFFLSMLVDSTGGDK